MKRKFARSGLRETVSASDVDLNEKPRDSYGEFLGGVWKWFSIFKLFKRYVRWVMSAPKEKPEHKKNGRVVPAGIVHTVNERVDLSVIHRCQRYPDYRPASLLEWAERKKLKLEDVIQNPAGYTHFWSAVSQSGIEN
jgi:hypothetical protein